MTQQWVIRKKIELEFSKWLNHNDLTSWLYLVGRNKEIKVMSVKEPYLFSDLIKICRATVHPTTRTSTPTTNSSIATFTCLASGSSQCQRTGQWRSKSGVIWVSWFTFLSFNCWFKASNNHMDGYTTWFTSPSRIYSFFDVLPRNNKVSKVYMVQIVSAIESMFGRFDSSLIAGEEEWVSK